MNTLVRQFEDKLETIKAWRHHMHKHPELSLEEAKTARFIADLVKSWGGEVKLAEIVDGYSGLEHTLPTFPTQADALRLMAFSGITYTPTTLVAYGEQFPE